MGLRSSMGAGIRVRLEGANDTLYLWLILLGIGKLTKNTKKYNSIEYIVLSSIEAPKLETTGI